MSTNSLAPPLRAVYPWRIEAKQTAFHPWAVLSLQAHLNVAVAEAQRQHDMAKFYATRVRAN